MKNDEKIPNSAYKKAALVSSLSKRIGGYCERFTETPKHFRDGQSKRTFERIICRRARLLFLLEQQNIALWQKTMSEIQSVPERKEETACG